MANIEKLHRLASAKSRWLDEAKERQNNKAWLKHSRKIAVKVLGTLRERGIKQKELAEMLNVSPQQINKIVKGKENLTLETISKLELVLGIRLMSFESSPYNIIIKNVIKTNYVYFHVYGYKKEVAKRKSAYIISEESFIPDMVNETCEQYGG